MRGVFVDHLYWANAFKVSDELMGKKLPKELRDRRNHICLRSGLWCWENAFDRPQDIITFLIRKFKDKK